MLKFNNLLEKAKSVIDDVNKNLNSPSLKNPSQYDDTYFTIALKGGPLHTDLLTINATVAEGYLL